MCLHSVKLSPKTKPKLIPKFSIEESASPLCNLCAEERKLTDSRIMRMRSRAHVEMADGCSIQRFMSAAAI